jgi:hypothetical protein
MKQRFSGAFAALLIALVLVAAGIVGTAYAQTQQFGWIVTKRLTVQNVGVFQSGVEMDSTLSVEGILSAGSAVQADGDVATGSDLQVAAFVRTVPTTAISVTNGATITPTGTYQPLESAGNVGFSGIAVGTAGDHLILINESNTTITLTDTGTLMLSGNAALGQYDVIHLLSDGTNWIQVAPEGDN